MASQILFSVEDLRTPEGTELVLQQFRTAIQRIPAQQAQVKQRFSLEDLSAEDIANLAKLIRDQLQAPGAAPLSLQDLPGTPAVSSPGGSGIPGSYSVSYVVGTLSPNTKPFLTILNIYQVIFYSTDFDHEYLWDGFAWKAIEYTSGSIVWRSTSPGTAAGWQFCDGSTVTASTLAGGTASVTVPDLVTGNPYIRGGVAYSGPTATAAIAPTMSGTTGSESSHTHSVTATGGVTGNVPAHAHVLLDNLIDGGGLLMGQAVFLDGTSWDVAGDLSGTTQATDVDHLHGITDVCAPTGTPLGTVQVSNTTLDIEVASLDHTHPGLANGATDTVSGGLSHDHGVGSLAFTSTSEDHFHLVTGRTETTISGGPYALSLTFTGTPVSSGSGSAHSHSIGTIAAGTNGEPLHMTLLPYFRL